MDRFQGGKACWFEGHELSVWKKGIYTTTEMIHRGDAQMNSYPYDRTTSAEDTPEMYRSLLVCTGLMWVAGCRAFEKTDMIRYKFQAQPFNHIRDISWPKSMNISSQGSIVGAEVSNDLMIDFTATQPQKRCGCYSSEWTFDSFWFCILARRETDSGVCETLSMSDRCWCDTCKSGLTYFLTYKVPCHLCIWCKDMPNTATCTAFWFWLITLRAKAFKCSRLKNVGKRWKKQGSYTRTGLLAHPGILYVL